MSAVELPARLDISRKLSIYASLALVLLYLVTGLFAEEINWTVTLVPCFTLLIFLPGMLASHARSFDWLCFVILLHFIVGVSDAMSAQPAWHDYLQTALSVLIFISAMLSSRWIKAHQNPHS